MLHMSLMVILAMMSVLMVSIPLELNVFNVLTIALNALEQNLAQLASKAISFQRVSVGESALRVSSQIVKRTPVFSVTLLAQTVSIQPPKVVLNALLDISKRINFVLPLRTVSLVSMRIKKLVIVQPVKLQCVMIAQMESFVKLA
jgi:hypothetical protein